MIDVEALTVKEIKEIAAIAAGFTPVQATAAQAGCPWQIGKVYLIRTVTMIQTGRLVGVTPQELVLEDAAWIADTGLFSEALKTLNFAEIEPFPDGPVIVGRGAVVDAVVIPKVQRVRK